MGKRKKDMFGASTPPDTAQGFSEITYGKQQLTDDFRTQLASEFDDIEGEKIKAGELHIDEFVIDTNALELRYNGDTADLTFDEWRRMGAYLHQHQSTIQWMIGDWVLLAENHLDEWVSENDETWQEIKTKLKSDQSVPEGKYMWLALHTDYSYSSLTKFKHYAEMFPVFRRRKTLTYSHHVEVAKLDDIAAQNSMLDAAVNPPPEMEKERLSVRELRDLIATTYSLGAGDTAGNTSGNPIQTNIDKLKEFTGSKAFLELSKKQRKALYHDLQSILRQMEEAGV